MYCTKKHYLTIFKKFSFNAKATDCMVNSNSCLVNLHCHRTITCCRFIFATLCHGGMREVLCRQLCGARRSCNTHLGSPTQLVKVVVGRAEALRTLMNLRFSRCPKEPNASDVDNLLCKGNLCYYVGRAWENSFIYFFYAIPIESGI